MPHSESFLAQKTSTVSEVQATQVVEGSSQTEPGSQPPQSSVRVLPQVSAAVTWPHRLPWLGARRSQNSVEDSVVQGSQTFVCSLQAFPGGHPQAADLSSPQLSGAVTAPQRATRTQSCSSDSATHSHVRVAWLQASGAAQVSHATVREAPQVSVAVSGPHATRLRTQSAKSDSGAHLHVKLACSQVKPAAQPPQVPPQPSSPHSRSTQRGWQVPASLVPMTTSPGAQPKASSSVAPRRA
jgi:hypothetical protein